MLIADLKQTDHLIYVDTTLDNEEKDELKNRNFES